VPSQLTLRQSYGRVSRALRSMHLRPRTVYNNPCCATTWCFPLSWAKFDMHSPSNVQDCLASTLFVEWTVNFADLPGQLKYKPVAFPGCGWNDPARQGVRTFHPRGSCSPPHSWLEKISCQLTRRVRSPLCPVLLSCLSRHYFNGRARQTGA
jgi:hypothetical protein